MNRLLHIFFSLTAGIFILLTSCKLKKKEIPRSAPDIYYTCSMDPQVIESQPGKCPICHMELTAVHKSQQQNNNELQLSAQQVQLGNITVDTLRSDYTGKQLLLAATLSVDPSRTNAISTRIAGRIDHLYFSNIGDYIPKGAKLYDLYSEEMNNAKQEYLLALEKRKVLGNSIVDFDQLIAGARSKLLLWGMTNEQINALTASGKTTRTTTFYSTTAGTVTSSSVKEGDYIPEGGTLFRLADLSTLWAEAQVYTSQLAQLSGNETAAVQIPGLPDMQPIQGSIDQINPEVSPDTRVDLIRINIPNKDGLLKPGMPAYVTIKNPRRKALSLPIDAVLRNGKTNRVWIQLSPNTFKSRMVETGQEGDGLIEIRSGLQAGDIVVISGAYLLQSEYIFRKGVTLE